MAVLIDRVTRHRATENGSRANLTRGAERHPEKRNNPDQPSVRKPSWIRVKAPIGKGYNQTMSVVRDKGLVTVCEEAGCPNIGECWEKKHATFMVMGSICTRACAFCNVATGKPRPLDPDEPGRVASATAAMGLNHCVVTSVDRDDLPDGGADHFVRVIEELRRQCPQTSIEILTPDFKNKPLQDVHRLIDSRPDVFNHNLETVPRLYPDIRPGARYFTSLSLLSQAKQRAPDIFTKSGLMVGLGESLDEVGQVMDDLRAADVDFITIGQYLQPTVKHAPIARFVPPDEFESLANLARGKGFLMVSSSPLTRSSHHAGEAFQALQQQRQQQIERIAS